MLRDVFPLVLAFSRHWSLSVRLWANRAQSLFRCQLVAGQQRSTVVSKSCLLAQPLCLSRLCECLSHLTSHRKMYYFVIEFELDSGNILCYLLVSDSFKYVILSIQHFVNTSLQGWGNNYETITKCKSNSCSKATSSCKRPLQMQLVCQSVSGPAACWNRMQSQQTNNKKENTFNTNRRLHLSLDCAG